MNYDYVFYYFNSAIWGLQAYFDEVNKKHSALNEVLQNYKPKKQPNIDNIKFTNYTDEDDVETIESSMQFIRGNFNNADLPKMVLNVMHYYFIIDFSLNIIILIYFNIYLELY